MGVAIVEANEREFSSITVVRMLLVLVIKRIVSLVRVSKYRRLVSLYGKLNFYSVYSACVVCMSSMSPVKLYIDLSIIDIVFIYLYIIALIHEFLRF